MKTILFKFFLIVVVSVSVTSCYYDNEEDLYPYGNNTPCDTLDVTYSQTIAPIMASNCNNCHNPVSPNGGVITSTYDGLKIVADNGKLYNSVFWVDGAIQMPQGSSQLSSCNLSKINIWIKNGAKND